MISCHCQKTLVSNIDKFTTLQTKSIVIRLCVCKNKKKVDKLRVKEWMEVHRGCEPIIFNIFFCSNPKNMRSHSCRTKPGPLKNFPFLFASYLYLLNWTMNKFAKLLYQKHFHRTTFQYFMCEVEKKRTNIVLLSRICGLCSCEKRFYMRDNTHVDSFRQVSVSLPLHWNYISAGAKKIWSQLRFFMQVDYAPDFQFFTVPVLFLLA